MSTLSETGHARNAARFDELIESIAPFLKDYGPAKQSLKMDSMKNMSGELRNALNEVIAALTLYKAAVNARTPMYDAMNKLIPRILSILQASDVPDETIQTFKSIARKIAGRRATPFKTKNTDPATGPEFRAISSSQRSFDNQLENFLLFIEQLKSTPGYIPSETMLQPPSLQAMADDMKQRNAAVVAARIALKDARSKRDNLMYKKGTGMVDVAFAAKAYIKGAFGPKSPEFMKVSKLKFTRN